MAGKNRALRVYKPDDVLDFGKHNGETLKRVMMKDPGWIFWALENVSWFDMTKEDEEVARMCLDDKFDRVVRRQVNQLKRDMEQE